MKSYLIRYIRKQKKYEHIEAYNQNKFSTIIIQAPGRESAIKYLYNYPPKDFQTFLSIVLWS